MKKQAIIQSTFILPDHDFPYKRFLQEHHNMQQQKIFIRLRLLTLYTWDSGGLTQI